MILYYTFRHNCVFVVLLHYRNCDLDFKIDAAARMSRPPRHLIVNFNVT